MVKSLIIQLHTLIKRFRDSPIQAGSLLNNIFVAKIGHCLLLVMAIISLKTRETLFVKSPHSHA